MPAQFRALKRRVETTILRGVLRAVTDEAGVQRVAVGLLRDQVKDNAERLQQYGLTSHPLPGAPLLAVMVGDGRDYVILAADDHRYRLTLKAGEVSLYDDQGQRVTLARDGVEVEGSNILLKTEGVCRIDAERVEIRGNESLQTEVHGWGERRSHLGGADYQLERWTIGATETASDSPIDPPDLPSDHPKGSA